MSAAPGYVDETTSYAFRDGGVVRVVLHLPNVELQGDSASVRLRHEDQKFRRRATVTPAGTGFVLEFDVPRRRLAGKVWRLAIQPSQPGPFVRLQARLLDHAGQPVALMPGPAPRTQMAPPAPRRNLVASGRRLAGRGRRVAGRASRGVRSSLTSRSR